MTGPTTRTCDALCRDVEADRDRLRTELDFERARVAEVQGAIHRIHYPIGDPATEGNVWCACDKLWPCETVTAISKAVLGSPSALDPAGVGYAIRVTLLDGTTSIRHEDDPFTHREDADRYAGYARLSDKVATAEVLYQQVWHGPWTAAPEPTAEADRG